MTMANQLNYINLNLKHLPSKYNSLQYSSGKKPKEDGEVGRRPKDHLWEGEPMGG